MPSERFLQAEGAFGAIKENYKFRQFLLRGKKKVQTEIAIVAMAYDINKSCFQAEKQGCSQPDLKNRFATAPYLNSENLFSLIKKSVSEYFFHLYYLSNSKLFANNILFC